MAYYAKNVWIDDAFPYSGQTLHYCVYRNNDKIYEGEATARDFPIVIYLNRIAQDYLESSAPGEFENGKYMDSGASAFFSLVEMTYRNGEWVEGEVLYATEYIDAWGCWDESDTIAATINGHADIRQKLLYSKEDPAGRDPFIYSGDTEVDSGDTIAAAGICRGSWKFVRVMTEFPYYYSGKGINHYYTEGGKLYWIVTRRALAIQSNIMFERAAPRLIHASLYVCETD